jgi:hypothetical protein
VELLTAAAVGTLLADMKVVETSVVTAGILEDDVTMLDTLVGGVVVEEEGVALEAVLEVLEGLEVDAEEEAPVEDDNGEAGDAAEVVPVVPGVVGCVGWVGVIGVVVNEVGGVGVLDGGRMGSLD